MEKLKKKRIFLGKITKYLKEKLLENSDWWVYWSFKEKQTLRDITLSNKREAANFKFDKVMLQNEHGIEYTPVTDASMSVSKTSSQ